MLNEIHLFQGPTKAPTAPSGGWWGLSLIGALVRCALTLTPILYGLIPEWVV